MCASAAVPRGNVHLHSLRSSLICQDATLEIYLSDLLLLFVRKPSKPLGLLRRTAHRGICYSLSQDSSFIIVLIIPSLTDSTSDQGNVENTLSWNVDEPIWEQITENSTLQRV